MHLVDPSSLHWLIGEVFKETLRGLSLRSRFAAVFKEHYRLPRQQNVSEYKILGSNCPPKFCGPAPLSLGIEWMLRGKIWAHDSGDLPWHFLSQATSFQRGWAPSFDGLTLSLQGISMCFKSSTGNCAARPALRTRSQHCRKFGDKQRPRDENEVRCS